MCALFRKRKTAPKILVLIDVENLYTNLLPIGPETISFSTGFDRVMKKIAREIGSIEDVFAFAPSHLVQLLGEELYWQGVTIVACPKVSTKDGRQNVDTVDQVLIEFGKKAIRQMQGLTHLCIGSGDKDFALLVKEAIRKGLRILVIASSKESLSTDLIDLSDQVFLFFSTE